MLTTWRRTAAFVREIGVDVWLNDREEQEEEEDNWQRRVHKTTQDPEDTYQNGHIFHKWLVSSRSSLADHFEDFRDYVACLLR